MARRPLASGAPPLLPDTSSQPPSLAAVLDMGASAIRLVIAEIAPKQPIRIIEEASRGVLLGRDTFSAGTIRSRTVDAAIDALDGFRTIMEGYGVSDVRAVATSAVREARNGDLFLDRIANRTGITFEIINEAEESRLTFLAVRDALGRHPAFKSAWTLLAEVGGGSTSLTLMRRGQPTRSGVFALGAVRLRQQFDLRAQQQDVQIALLNRYIANVVEEIRLEIPLRRITQMVAIGGDIRFAASQILDGEHQSGPREIPRDSFIAFCDEVQRLDEEALVERFRLPAVEADTLVPSLLVYRTLFAETAARRLVVSEGSLRAGLLIDMTEPDGPIGAEDFERQVLASAESLGQRYRVDRAHGRHVARLATRIFDDLGGEHGLTARERLLLQVAALLHDVGIYVSLRAHHKHSQYILAASQIFGLSDDETAVVSNVARYHRRGFPQRSHLAYISLDRQDRITVAKLAAILRVANALDAEHAQKVDDVRLVARDNVWMLELEGTGDLTMERLAATARADMFGQTFGRPLLIRPPGAVS
jgi:exopolyphosphatase / guanosine-5'-triphosphate,3'-diphosphate pyrophosphatase